MLGISCEDDFNYAGQIVDDKEHGKGKLYIYDDLIFEGEFKIVICIQVFFIVILIQLQASILVMIKYLKCFCMIVNEY